MTRVAVVDIGSNSTRLLIADVGAGVTEVERRSIVTRLGEGVEATGKLGEQPRERVHEALAEYAAAIAEHGATRATAVMTSAVRDASNGDEFAATINERYGLDARTLSGDEEAQLTFLGATAARTPEPGERLLVIDIGGGSTELVIGERGDVAFHVSTQVGVVRHSERHLHSDPPTPGGAAGAQRRRRSRARRRGPGRERTRSRPRSRWPAPRPSARASTSATRPTTSRATSSRSRRSRRCSNGSPRCRSRERREVPGLDPDRAPTIVAGVVVLTRALAAFGLDEVEVSDRDILWGAALELASAT